MNWKARTGRLAALAAGLCGIAGTAGAADLTLDVRGRSVSPSDAEIDSLARRFGSTSARLTLGVRRKLGVRVVYSQPMRLFLTRNGSPLPTVRSRGREAGDLTLAFETAGNRAFPAEYRAHLEGTFTAARSTLNAVFGSPKTGGTVRIRNYDADIPDTQAVAGGVYIPNAVGGPEIRFPVYSSPTAASINFIHTLLLAYLADNPSFAESWTEGMVRAAVMSVARTPGTIPGSPTSAEIEQVLDALYDISAGYDWSNQPGLGAEPFIAPNLLNLPLPVGGSTGGPFLLRYRMAGTAWAKVAAEHPGFLAEFNRRRNLNPALYATETALVDLGQTVLNALVGGTGTVEGLSFAEWVRRQAILHRDLSPGTKTALEVIPLQAGAGSSDFGVFGFLLHAVRREAGGSEVLLSGRTHPVYWRPDALRFFAAGQDDVIDVAGGFGSVAPNFARSTFDGRIFRSRVEIPFQGRMVRASVPAGAVSTGQAPTPNNLYGTLTGFPNGSYSLDVRWTGGSRTSIPTNLMAFGLNISDSSFDRAQPLDITLRRIDVSPVQTVLTGRVNKGWGAFGMDLQPASAWQTFNLARSPGLSLSGVPVEPARGDAEALLGASGGNLLIAHWNAVTGRWDQADRRRDLVQGGGFFHRPTVTTPAAIFGRRLADTAVSLALTPGWNAVRLPESGGVPDARVAVASAAEALSTLTEARGTILGPTFFRFERDPANPDVGTYQPETGFASGEALFVNVLRSEGAILATLPGTSSAAPRRTVIGPGSGGVQEPERGVDLRLVSPRGLRSSVEMRVRTDASDRLDPALDSPLPPSMGGMQTVVLGPSRMSRDVRSSRQTNRFRVTFEGLIPGQTYRIEASATDPGIRAYYTDRLNRRGGWIGPRFFASFRAAASTHEVEVMIGGVR
ncbi:MAG: hypothetical protein MH204_08195 [Fimbriimonadaceae bacterium]|nr:hypothetical protein [Fimbriimonadaceae bacterium]